MESGIKIFTFSEFDDIVGYVLTLYWVGDCDTIRSRLTSENVLSFIASFEYTPRAGNLLIGLIDRVMTKAKEKYMHASKDLKALWTNLIYHWFYRITTLEVKDTFLEKLFSCIDKFGSIDYRETIDDCIYILVKRAVKVETYKSINVKWGPKGQTVLHRAANLGLFKTMQDLFSAENKINVNIKDEDGEEPMMIVFKKYTKSVLNKCQIMSLLDNPKINVNIENYALGRMFNIIRESMRHLNQSEASEIIRKIKLHRSISSSLRKEIDSFELKKKETLQKKFVEFIKELVALVASLFSKAQKKKFNYAMY